MFSFPADRLPVAVILSVTCIDFGLYFLIDSIWILAAWWLLMIVPKGAICAWNHHHQHTLTFKNMALNRVLEFFYALHTGVTSNLWFLHHVFGHHRNYMDQTKDESRWKRKSGEMMGELEYTLNVAGTAYYRGFRVGDRLPKARRVFLFYTTLTLIAVALLIWMNPVPALFLFVLPMISGLLITAWATYEHHSGLETDNPFEASRNNLHPLYNLATGNLGYHTAHHYKHWVHWSELPALHELIKDRIPDRLIKYEPISLSRANVS